MKVTGFTFIRNAVKFDYPIVEAITSILPICTDFVIAVGKSDDATTELIKSIGSDKIKIVETVWDDNLRVGGKVLAQETDKAFHAIDKDTDWCFYIQGDEVVHEKYLDNIKQAMEKHLADKRVDGLLFNYLHFYGSYDYISMNPNLYGHEIRVIRNDRSIYSYRDAQGFRKGDDQKLNVKPIDAFVFHYGCVKKPKAMQMKTEEFDKLWHSDEWVKKRVKVVDEFDYEQNQKFLAPYQGTYPKVMLDRVKNISWKFVADTNGKYPYTTKQKVKKFIEEKIGYNLSYRNYKII